MKKLWDKGKELSPLIEKFMTGDDYLLDQKLVAYDCLGSIAHGQMLQKIGILTLDEFQKLKAVLLEIIELEQKGEFSIDFGQEDVHTAVENFLTKKLGALGKKIHTARSRNDQVLTDLRLFMRTETLKIEQELLLLCKKLCSFAKKNASIPYVGRTHFQKAMPSSMGLWAGSFLESLLDDIKLLKNAYEILDQCPLGSAASYGVSLPIDRQLTADLLGFQKVQNNVLYANNSRGKFEAILLNALVQIMIDLSKLATDIILFSVPEFGYFLLPASLCAGSSLMPQKCNPCPLELIRAKSAVVTANLFQTLEIIRALPSGYNRDFQETKRPLMQSLDITLSSIQVMGLILSELKVDEAACLKGFSPEVFATDKVLELAQKGEPFRDAYLTVAKSLEKVELVDPKQNILSKTHLGSTGNLGIHLSEEKIEDLLSALAQQFTFPML